nr:hypothetical protein [Tanacetum cinerariifolium]
MCKLREDVRNIREELSEYINSPSWNYPTFYNDEEYSIQYKEYLENSSDAIAPVLPTEEPEYSLSMGECEVTFDDKNECDVPICENSPIFDDNSEILSNSNDDDISSDDNVFEDIKYVEASPLDSQLVSLEEENDVYQEDEEFNLEDIQDVILHEKLLSINRLIADIKTLNDNPTPDCVLKSSASFPIFEESDNSLSISDNSSPEFETFSDHTEETRSGEVISAVMNNIDELNEDECFDPGGEIDSSRLLRYAKSRPNGKLIHNSIINGPYVRQMIPEPGDTNREVPVNETFHIQTDDELTEKELKQIEADDQAIQTILLGLPKDIYAAVDRQNVGNLNGYNDVQNVENQVAQNPRVQNVRNLNGQIGVPGNVNLNRNGNVVAARAEGNEAGHNGNQMRCYNSRGKEEAGIQLQAEEFDLMAAAANLDEIEEVNANCILMANLQQAST